MTGGAVRFDQGGSYPSGYKLNVGATSGLFVDSTGNLGIATTAPTGLLEVGTTTLGYPALFVTAGGNVGTEISLPFQK